MEVIMSKESKHHRDERKKPSLSFKEKRMKKQEKRLKKQQQQHIIDMNLPPQEAF
jgi:hypothetical protein